jgi:WD40 repeat protein
MGAETELRPKLIMASPVVGRHETSTIQPRQKFEGHTGWVRGAIHLPDGQRMVTGSRDGSLRVWNLKSGKQIGKDWRDGDIAVRTIALSPDGTKVVTGSSDGGVGHFQWNRISGVVPGLVPGWKHAYLRVMGSLD